MRASTIITKIFFVLYIITCIGTEIWHLVPLHNVLDYPSFRALIISSDVIYFTGNIFLIIFILVYRAYDDAPKKLIINISGGILICAMLNLSGGPRYLIPIFTRETIPFNCDFEYNASENIKIACRRRFISYTLDFSLYAFALLIISLNYLFPNLPEEIRIISDSLQRNMFIL